MNFLFLDDLNDLILKLTAEDGSGGVSGTYEPEPDAGWQISKLVFTDGGNTVRATVYEGSTLSKKTEELDPTYTGTINVTIYCSEIIYELQRGKNHNFMVKKHGSHYVNLAKITSPILRQVTIMRCI